MKFGTFYEMQVPDADDDRQEHEIFEESLDQVELADELGYDYAWEVEHHFLTEYSHSSAPAVFLSAAAERTEDIRLAHGIRLTPPKYNHPVRVAEKAGTLDIISEGRLDLGTGSSTTPIEMGGFGVDPDRKGDMWEEATEQIADMMAMEPYPGHDGEFVSMPARNVVPKPRQRPHPPMWMACATPATMEIAARNGIGALLFSFKTPDEASEWVDLYYETFKDECVPIGHAVNPNVATVTGFSCHEDEDEAHRRGAEGIAFFNYSIDWVATRGEHVIGHTNIWENFLEEGGASPYEEDLVDSAIGTPDQLREHFRAFEDAGVDQMILLQQAGKIKHEHICESLELFAETVMPEFHETEHERQAEKREELEPYIEDAFERKEEKSPPPEDELTPSAAEFDERWMI